MDTSIDLAPAGFSALLLRGLSEVNAKPSTKMNGFLRSRLPCAALRLARLLAW